MLNLKGLPTPSLWRTIIVSRTVSSSYAVGGQVTLIYGR